ncbi:MAG: threonine--tRNA ligase [Solirubrobacterales bacterium]|nr:threonine--tRNA ligase [Solirubrobacterales bacterium]
MNVTLPDGTVLDLAEGATGGDAALAIGEGLARAALAIEVNGDLRDLSRPLPDDAKINIITGRSPEALELVRHDTAHVLAAAVMELYPGVKISIGPPIENGFYYDFEFPDGAEISDADFPRIEAAMKKHIKAKEQFTRQDVTTGEAMDKFAREGQDYKVELIEDLIKNEGADTVSLYTNGPFTDLCRGPHAPDTSKIKAFKLTSIAGAYWRGDSDRTMLTRIYGTAFLSKEDLAEHLHNLEEAKKRDHRRLGKQLDLFSFNELSPGSPFWHPNGMKIWNALADLWREQNVFRGYQEVRTPIIYDAELWKQSGHWDKYRDNMYFTEVEDRQFGLKPMNCPAHIQIYKDDRRSYRDLPLRLSEAGLVHRHEPSGTLHGLMRVRHITQDDAHIFCTEDQIQEEVQGIIDHAFYIYEIFGFEYKLELSTRPENRLGTDEQWDLTEGALQGALDNKGLEYEINPGDGAFYGPKIDMHMRDSLGRSWQLGTIQLDYQMPERFDMTYAGPNDDTPRPVMIHRALFGSFERFIGILIEHFGGDFPLWLAPTQVQLIPVSDKHNGEAQELAARLAEDGLRADVDTRTESVGKKIREAELAKAPYMWVVGDEEVESGTIAPRKRHQTEDGERVPIQDAIDALIGEVTRRER